MQAPPSLDDLLTELEPLLGSVSGFPQALDGGITNRNYRVRMGDGDYVVRVSGKDTSVLGIDRGAECEATRIAARLGVAPEVAAFLPQHDCLVTRFVAGRPVAEAELRAEPILSAVAGLLRTVHGGPPLPARFDAFAIVRSYRDEIVARGGAEPAAYARADAAAQRIAAVLVGPDHAPVACHNDLLAGNILRDGERLRIVDWEYAGMGDRFFDLANLSVNNGFAAADEARLLEVYFDEPPTARHRAVLSLMRVMSDFREAMWGAVQAVVSDMDVDYDAYAAEHFARLLVAINSDPFEEDLHAATA
jgi:thiamine kinase-like enzyme